MCLKTFLITFYTNRNSSPRFTHHVSWSLNDIHLWNIMEIFLAKWPNSLLLCGKEQCWNYSKHPLCPLGGRNKLAGCVNDDIFNHFWVNYPFLNHLHNSLVAFSILSKVVLKSFSDVVKFISVADKIAYLSLKSCCEILCCEVHVKYRLFSLSWHCLFLC